MESSMEIDTSTNNGSSLISDSLISSSQLHNSQLESSSNNVNGELQKNGHSSSEKKHKHKDKHKDKKHKHHKHDKDKDRHRSKDKERDKDRESSKSSRDKEKEKEREHNSKDKKDEKVKVSSSSSPSKDSSPSKSHSHSHKSKHREKDKERDSKDVKPKLASPLKVEIKEEIKVEPNSSQSTLDDEEEDYKYIPPPVKEENMTTDEDEDDIPLSARRKSLSNGSSNSKVKKRKVESDSEDDVPLSQRKKPKTEIKRKSKVKSESEEEEDDEEDSEESDYDDRKKKMSTPAKKKSHGSSKNSSARSSPTKKNSSQSSSQNSSPKKGRKGKEEEEEEIWEWWKEAPREDGVKWNFLQHKGPVFAPDYEPLPKDVKFRYNGKSVKLSMPSEEVAGFYSRFIEHDYTTKEMFNKNFFKDWRKVMNPAERELITDLKKCDFTAINEYYKKKSEERKAMSKEEKLKLKEENERITKEYGICLLDGHKEKIGNFRIEPPGLFRGRGEHPKMGMLKTRVMPEEVVINCSKDAVVPQPPKGHKWKEVRHDNTVSWLASWTENVQGQPKYVMLNPTSRLKGEKDWMKYEKARELSKKIGKIRDNYKNDFKSKEMRIRQRAVAMYFIDKLALRAGNEKDEDQADTVGCCSLRYEHIKLDDEKDGKECVVTFDFLGKDSIRYYNEVPVEKRVYKNLKLFMQNKKEGDDLFDRLNTAILNKYLSDLMDGLTAKVFRTYNASHTLQEQLDELTPKNGTVQEKVLAYNRANRAVAILCNHQRAAPKSHEKSMENLGNKIEQKRQDVKDAKKELKQLKKGSKEYEKKENALKRAQDQLARLEMNKTDKEEGKEIALGTSKLNYLDPRITVAWCKKHDVPIEKAYNKTQRAKFRWAIDMVDKTYRFD